jgi:hypothetical protein
MAQMLHIYTLSKDLDASFFESIQGLQNLHNINFVQTLCLP